ncbi:hypothetical protein [uncultured Erythrobacter sp.]|uniref:hypothetical protein n=1 Tax=uncultured Erythrobacter sp. TaxID=263913 RepID=UPI00262ECE24|nr:hypothetical protein [uncultured Erythrobacter sp.]
MNTWSRNICVAVALCSSSAALASDSGWTISEADGQVSIMRDDKAVYGAKGTRLQVGDVIRTKKAARAVLVRGDDFYIVAPNKQVRIIKVEEDSTATKVMNFVGNMLSSNTQHSSLKRPMEAAVVKGMGGGLENGLVQNEGKAEDSAGTDD